MPNFNGGAYGADETLTAALVELFLSWESDRPDDAHATATAIAEQVGSERLDRANHETEAESLTGERRYTSGDYNRRVNQYIAALEATRAAWLNLPPDAQQVMPQFFWSCSTTFLTPEILKELSLAHVAGRSSDLVEWRAHGLDEHQYWGADIEVLDLLAYAAKQFKEQHAPDKSARDRWEPKFIRTIASVCEHHGIRASASTGGHFTSVIELLFPQRDARDLIRQALRLGKYSKKL